MGMITKVNSLEEMCDNKLPTPEKEEWWIFTFGWGQRYQNKYVKIWGTYESAREKMFERYGKAWAFQYSEKEWEDWEARRPSYIPVETLLEEIR